MRTMIIAFALAAFALPLAAQEGADEFPAGWELRLDRAGDPSEVKFTTMPPGWHITTGPAGILYNPATTASGEYRVESVIHLFDPGQRQREAFGIFFGGTDLKADNHAYMYFLIRNDGSYLIKHRAGADTHVISEWTQHESIVRHAGGDDTVKNTLAVEVGADAVDFYINGQKVTELPKGEMNVDGVVGLRVNHGLNLHVSELNVSSSTDQ